MIEANTYVFAGGQYQPITAAQGPLPDPHYIKGILELSIDGQAIIARAEWDLVDQLWEYIVNGAEELAQHRSFSTRFPDQPIELRFTIEPHSDRVMVELRYPGLDRPAKAVVDRRELISAIARAAAPVFARLIELAPANRDGYELVLHQIAMLTTHG
jgi:hypothetical protein